MKNAIPYKQSHQSISMLEYINIYNSIASITNGLIAIDDKQAKITAASSKLRSIPDSEAEALKDIKDQYNLSITEYPYQIGVRFGENYSKSVLIHIYLSDDISAGKYLSFSYNLQFEDLHPIFAIIVNKDDIMFNHNKDEINTSVSTYKVLFCEIFGFFGRFAYRGWEIGINFAYLFLNQYLSSITNIDDEFKLEFDNIDNDFIEALNLNCINYKGIIFDKTTAQKALKDFINKIEISSSIKNNFDED